MITHNVNMRQGATFYEEFYVYPTSELSIAQIRAMTPRATILDTGISFACSWLPVVEGETYASGVWTLSRDTTATLDAARSYNHNLDIFDDTYTYPIAKGMITVEKGQKPV